MSKNDDEDKQAFKEAMRHIVPLSPSFAKKSPLPQAEHSHNISLPSIGHDHTPPLPLAGEGGTKRVYGEHGAKRRESVNKPSQADDLSKLKKDRLKPRSAFDAATPTVIRPQPYQPDVGAEDTLSYQDPSINHLSWRRFKTGQLRLDMHLDLHGLTLIGAEQALEAFMFRARDTGAQYLLIIHGKGSHDGNTPPVLKNWLWRWLRNDPQVLAIHSAPKHKGGTGAVLVWLKKS